MSASLLTAMLVAALALLWGVLLTAQVHEHCRYVRASLRRAPRRWHAPPRVLVIVPCKGLDLGLRDNLRHVFAQDYPAYQVRLVVDRADDPACTAIQQLMTTTSVDCELVFAGSCNDSGQKVHNLRRATAALPDDIEVLAFFDSDARPTPDALARLVNRVCRGGLQVATGYRWFVPQRLSVANLTLASVNAAVASLLNHQGWNLVWGGAWAITRQLFDQTALVDAWRGTLSDDLVASRVMRLSGVKVAFEPGCMVTSPIDASWKGSIAFLRRQFLIGRCYAPRWWWATLPLMVLQPLVLFGGLALAFYLAWRQAPYWYLPLLLSVSLYAMAIVRAHWRQATWSTRVIAAPDALRAAAWFDRLAAPWSCLFATTVMLTSAVGRSIHWRGIRYHIGPAGQIMLLGRALSADERSAVIANQARFVDRDDAARAAATNADTVGTSRQPVDYQPDCPAAAPPPGKRAA